MGADYLILVWLVPLANSQNLYNESAYELNENRMNKGYRLFKLGYGNSISNVTVEPLPISESILNEVL